jgi:hypothetical protein
MPQQIDDVRFGFCFFGVLGTILFLLQMFVHRAANRSTILVRET